MLMENDEEDSIKGSIHLNNSDMDSVVNEYMGDLYGKIEQEKATFSGGQLM